MGINIYEDKMSWAYLFSEAAVLYSREPTPREDVPEGWYCYDLRDTVKYPDAPKAGRRFVPVGTKEYGGGLLPRTSVLCSMPIILLMLKPDWR